MRSRVVCDESNALPMSGRATLATARLRLATAATRISETNTDPARAGDSGFVPRVAPLLSIVTQTPPVALIEPTNDKHFETEIAHAIQGSEERGLVRKSRAHSRAV